MSRPLLPPVPLEVSHATWVKAFGRKRANEMLVEARRKAAAKVAK